MAVLILPVRRKWFELIKAGAKLQEYRLHNDYWIRRIAGKHFDEVVITLGYPAKENTERRLRRPWRGYQILTVESDEWIDSKGLMIPQTVFAIWVN